MVVTQFFAGYANSQFPLFFSQVLHPNPQGETPFFDTISYQKRPMGVGLQLAIGTRNFTLFDR